jgi:protein-tyrosine phosphatase
MIDLHVHLLPAVDDGPPDGQTSLALAQALVAIGVHHAVVTPHIADWTRKVLPSAKAVAERTETLRANLRIAGIPLTIEPGGECYLTPDLPDRLARGLLPTWGRLPCLLVELPVGQPTPFAVQALTHLTELNIRVVLAHPERYDLARTHPEAMHELAARGVILQVTARAFLPGDRSRHARTARQLLERGLVHLVAGDTHGAADVEGLRGGLAHLQNLVGEAVLEILRERNPAALLAGEPLAPVPMHARRRLPFWSHAIR